MKKPKEKKEPVLTGRFCPDCGKPTEYSLFSKKFDKQSGKLATAKVWESCVSENPFHMERPFLSKYAGAAGREIHGAEAQQALDKILAKE